MHPILFEIGSFQVYTYAVFVSLGLVVGYNLACYFSRRMGLDPDAVASLLTKAIVVGFCGAKILFVILEWQAFIDNPLAMVRSGFVFYGGALSAVLYSLVMAPRKNIDLWPFLDASILGLVAAHSLGRIGCFFNGCCYGVIAKLPFGFARIPTQLISSFSLLLLFLFLLYQWRYRSPGRITFVYFTVYPIIRFVIEFFRGDPRGGFLFFSTSQWISLLVFIVALFIIFCISRRSKP